jgi:CubicO group peptidase (beta-lactamase class C family)
LDPARLQDAIAFAQAHESTMDRDLARALDSGHFGEPMPLGARVGPLRPRGGPAGLILQGGAEVARWGDVARADPTFSIAKSYLALLAGIAVADGLIPDIHAPVRELVADGGFDGPNAAITWAHLLNLTSEWQGELFGKPDWIDHYRDLDGAERPPIGTKRPLQAPGHFWEYNNVRVNRLSLALLQVFQRPLPEILAERIMAPIGASDTWEWHSYDTSWVDLEGQRVQSVPGGSHRGGGLWISSLDHARLGQLMLQEGVWEGQQLLDPEWLRFCRTPCALNPSYGALWWLNTDRALYPAAPETSFFAMGVGTQLLWIEPQHEMVVVLRWLEKAHVLAFLGKVMAAL